MKPLKKIDYVKLYAKRLKEDNSLFKQQKIFIESQFHASHSLFKNMFAGQDFKQRGLLK